MLAYKEWYKLFSEGKLNEVQSQFFKARAPEALYYIDEDPHETNNLANDKNYNETLIDLRNELNNHLVSINDLSFLPEPHLLQNGLNDVVDYSEKNKDLIKSLIEKKLPLFGICLGHQILALALGGKTKKMKLGHRGANHPVKNLINDNVEITSQNHGFEVVKENLPKNIEVTHKSLFDNSIEGIKLKNKPVFSVQYHPESNPGPQDSVYLFQEFINNMKKNAKKKRS